MKWGQKLAEKQATSHAAKPLDAQDTCLVETCLRNEREPRNQPDGAAGALPLPERARLALS